MDSAKFWAAFTAFILPALAITSRWLLGVWAQQKKEIEKYKAKNATHIMDELSSEISSLKSKITSENQKAQEMFRNLRKEIAEHKSIIMGQKGQIDTVMTVFEGTLDSARRISRELDSRVEKKIQTEVTKIRDMIYIGTKKLKKGQNGD